MQEPQEKSTASALCANNCGFFGSSDTQGYCSQCFKLVQNQSQTPQPTQQEVSVSSSNKIQMMDALKRSGEVAMAAASNSEAKHDDEMDTTTDNTTTTPATTTTTTTTTNTTTTTTSTTTPAATPAATTAIEEDKQSSSAATATGGEGGDDSTPSKRVQKNKTRCLQCRKKVGLLGFTCKCGFVFCGAHRYPSEHDCDFDHKRQAREQLAKENPLIQAAKITKI